VLFRTSASGEQDVGNDGNEQWCVRVQSTGKLHILTKEHLLVGCLEDSAQELERQRSTRSKSSERRRLVKQRHENVDDDGGKVIDLNEWISDEENEEDEINQNSESSLHRFNASCPDILQEEDSVGLTKKKKKKKQKELQQEESTRRRDFKRANSMGCLDKRQQRRQSLSKDDERKKKRTTKKEILSRRQSPLALVEDSQETTRTSAVSKKSKKSHDRSSKNKSQNKMNRRSSLATTTTICSSSKNNNKAKRRSSLAATTTDLSSSSWHNSCPVLQVSEHEWSLLDDEPITTMPLASDEGAISTIVKGKKVKRSESSSSTRRRRLKKQQRDLDDGTKSQQVEPSHESCPTLSYDTLLMDRQEPSFTKRRQARNSGIQRSSSWAALPRERDFVANENEDDSVDEKDDTSRNRSPSVRGRRAQLERATSVPDINRARTRTSSREQIMRHRSRSRSSLDGRERSRSRSSLDCRERSQSRSHQKKQPHNNDENKEEEDGMATAFSLLSQIIQDIHDTPVEYSEPKGQRRASMQMNRAVSCPRGLGTSNTLRQSLSEEAKQSLKQKKRSGSKLAALKLDEDDDNDAMPKQTSSSWRNKVVKMFV